ncbi:MAG TPA: LicD family protein [Marmoricola sp.]|nr:LicD family protein [Marmoricola sp.]
MSTTSEPTGTALSVDDERLVLPRSAQEQSTYDVLLNGHAVWSVQPERDADGAAGHRALAWPKALRRHLRGRARVAVRDHLTGEVLAESEHVFAGAADREVSVTDNQGTPLMLDKWGRLIKPLAAAGDELTAELVEQCVALMETIESRTGLPAFICYGTLLGAVRSGEFIGHDNDVDLAYASAVDHPADTVLEGYRVERALRDAGWKVRRGSGVRLNVPLRLSDGSTRFVDVFSAAWVEGVLYIPSDLGARIPREAVLPLTTVPLHGRDVPAPAESERLLAATYGESWRVPDPSFRYDSPHTLKRRFNGWWGGLNMGRKTWDAFSGRALGVVPDEPSAFARWVGETFPSDRPLVDLGAGTGRDTLHFAEAGRPVTAVDYSVRGLNRNLRRRRAFQEMSVEVETLNLYDLRAVLALGARLSRQEEPADLYGRFLLHALHPSGRAHVFRLASMSLRRGGHLFLEFRTGRDRGRPHAFDNQPRWFLRPARVRAAIARHGGTVVHQEQGTGLAILGDEDAHVCRMVATWQRP